MNDNDRASGSALADHITTSYEARPEDVHRVLLL
jgi:hypothetical protein